MDVWGNRFKLLAAGVFVIGFALLVLAGTEIIFRNLVG